MAKDYLKKKLSCNGTVLPCGWNHLYALLWKKIENVEHYKHLSRKKYSDNLLALVIGTDDEHCYMSNQLYIVLIYNLSYFLLLRAGIDQTLKFNLVIIWQVGLFIYCWLFFGWDLPVSYEQINLKEHFSSNLIWKNEKLVLKPRIALERLTKTIKEIQWLKIYCWN